MFHTEGIEWIPFRVGDLAILADRLPQVKAMDSSGLSHNLFISAAEVLLCNTELIHSNQTEAAATDPILHWLIATSFSVT